MAHSTPAHRAPNLVLIGYRATGKTSVGAELARVLRRSFIDLDQVLVQEAGCSIADLVSREGWEGFRWREKDLVARFAVCQGQVLAPGGGVILDPDNVRLLREHGIVIWLTADPAAIQARLAQDQPRDASRPSLTGSDTIQEVAAVLQTRQPLYQAAAHLIIDTAGLTIPQVVERVLAAVKSKEAAVGR